MNKDDYKNYNIWQPLLLSIVMIIGMVLGYKMNDADDPYLIQGVSDIDSHAIGASGRVEEIVRFIDARYVDEVNDDELIESAITTVLEQLDPHSLYIPPIHMQSIHDSMEGTFKGIGIESYHIDDTVNIISVVPDSPAERAGLEQFDQIISINDSIVAGQGLEFSSISDMLRADGQDKEIVIHKAKSKVDKKVSLSIGDIPIKSVEVFYMLDEVTGVIKIDRFSSQTYKEFMEALEDMVEGSSLANLIIDLRDNPGGYLPEATNILSQLIREKDRLLVYTEGRTNKKTEYTTTGKSFFHVDKIAVLIDENSASGSEILAGAIQDWDRGLVIGRRTFGKGLVQEQYDLSNGGAIRLTVARYYTPTGRSIQQSYDNLEDYHDITNRYVSDTLQITDTMKYFTNVLGREVYGGGGIFPDVYIPMKTIDEDPVLIDIMSEIPEWTFRKLKSGLWNENVKLSNVEDLIVSDATINDLSAYLQKIEIPYTEGYLTQYRSIIERSIKAQYTRYTKGVTAFNQYLDDTDQAMLEASKFIKADLSLKKYLENLD